MLTMILRYSYVLELLAHFVRNHNKCFLLVRIFLFLFNNLLPLYPPKLLQVELYADDDTKMQLPFLRSKHYTVEKV